MDTNQEFDSNKNLIVNYLPPSLSQDDVKEMFTRMVGPVSNCKLVRNKVTHESLGYAFIKFEDDALASQAIEKINGMSMQGKTIKVSYARQSNPDIQNSNVYVAGLPDSVSEDKLLSLFSPFGNVLSHKILTDPDGKTRGAGFVRYSLNTEASAAIKKMDGKTLPGSSAPLKVKLAIPPAKKQDSLQSLGVMTTNTLASFGLPDHTSSVRFNPMAATHARTPQTAVAAALAEHGVSAKIQKASVYVFGLQENHTELTLFELFSSFGGIINVKLVRDMDKEGQPCKGYGFVNFVKFEDAIKAVSAMNGVSFEERVLQVSIKQNKNPGVTNGQYGRTMIAATS